jgi:hypothetical protein
MPRLRMFAALMAIALPIADSTAQTRGKWPPDSLVNVRVIPRTTAVSDVIGTMRNISVALGVRCQHCHVGQEGQPLDRFDFASDEKRTKNTARQMMLMVQEVNRRLDSLPGRAANGIQVSCMTCHRGISRPVPLSQVVLEAGIAGGKDSAMKTYRALRQQYHGKDAYDFSEPSLNIAAFRLGRANKFDEALALLTLNEEMFPRSSGMYVFRGNIQLMRADTTAAAAAFREAVRLDSTNAEARGRLRAIGRP